MVRCSEKGNEFEVGRDERRNVENSGATVPPNLTACMDYLQDASRWEFLNTMAFRSSGVKGR